VGIRGLEIQSVNLSRQLLRFNIVQLWALRHLWDLKAYYILANLTIKSTFVWLLMV
jgi:hypothetical protein